MSDEIQVSQSGVSVALQYGAPNIQVSQAGVSAALQTNDPALQVSQSGVSAALLHYSEGIVVSQSGVSVALCVLPTAPTLFGAVSGGDVVLTWATPPYVAGYELQYSHDGVNFSFLATLPGSATTYTHVEPNPLLVWYYRLVLIHYCSTAAIYTNTVRLDIIYCMVRAIPSLLAEYKVLLYSQTGVLQAEFDAYRTLNFKHVLNDVSTATLVLSGWDSRINLFATNSIVEVWRRLPGYMPGAIPADRRRNGNWYVEWEGLFEDYEYTLSDNGDREYSAYCVSFVDLLRRREILYPASSTVSPSNKSNLPTQTAMYEFVRENAGVAATVANGRLLTGTMTNLQIPALLGGGPLWSGARAWRNLLDVLQDLSEYGGVDFDVIGKGGGRFNFETYVGQLGQDRTTSGLNPATGLNGAGNVPVVFSPEYENFAAGTLSSQRHSSANVIAALGRGEEASRETILAIDTSVIDAGRLNQRELTRNASGQPNLVALAAYADSVRQQLKAKDSLDFTPLLTNTTVYGVHFWWTDRVTATFQGITQNKRITQVAIKVDQRGETFNQWQFETL